MSGSTIKLNTVWYAGAKGDGIIEGDHLNIPIAIPINQAGSGDGAEPKQLLVSSAISCYIMTLAYMLDTNKLPVASLTMNTERISKQGITHYPHVQLNSKATEEQVEKVNSLFQKAHEECYIAQLLLKAGESVEVIGKTTIK